MAEEEKGESQATEASPEETARGNAESNWQDFGKPTSSPPKEEPEEEVPDTEADDESEESESGVSLTRRQKAAAQRVGIDPEDVTEGMLPLLNSNADLTSKLSRTNQELSKGKSYRRGKADTSTPPGSREEVATKTVTPLTDDELYDSTPVNERFSLLQERLDALEEVNHGLRSAVDRQEKNRMEEQDARETAEFDRLFAGLNKEDFSQFGIGLIDELDDDSPELYARSQLVEETIAIQERYKSRKSPITRTDAFEKALYILHPEQVRAHEAKARKRKNRQGTQIPLPEGRNTQETIPPQKAAESHWEGWTGD